MSSFFLKVTAQISGQRLDKILSQLSDIPSRAQALRLIQQGLVTINEKSLKASYIAHEGDLIKINWPEFKDLTKNSLPVNFKLDILYEDKDILIINKPAGIVVHPSHGHSQNTLVDALKQHTPDLSMGFDEHRPGIVHRLDKDTSGVMAIAKNNFSHQHLAEQFRHKTVDRIYYALVYGPANKISPKLAVESHLIRHPKNRKKFCSEKLSPSNPPKGRWSKTHFENLFQSSSKINLIKCTLDTGRTHQIRIHISELGYPILGDEIYGSIQKAKKLNSQLKKEIQSLKRIALHASVLGIEHPKSNKRLYFKTPWPEDLKPLVQLLCLNPELIE